MKKIGLSIFLAFLMTVSSIQPASAKLMTDITQILEKVSDYLQKINDTTQKISQQINQVKLMSVEGYNWDLLSDLAGEFLISKINLQQKINKMVAGSKAKKLQVMEANQDLYKQGATDNFSAKREVAGYDLNYLHEELAIAQMNYETTKPDCDNKKLAYELEDDVVEKDAKWGLYIECLAKLDLYATQIAELAGYDGIPGAIGVMSGVYSDQLAKEERASSGDENYKERVKHTEALVGAAEKNKTAEGEGGEEAEFATVPVLGDTEWDTEGTAERYRKDDEYYKKFIRRYFYDPEDPSFSGNEKGKETTVLFQSNLDRLNRERRFLYINTAVHLMQVAATTRREIGKRIGAAHTFSNETASSENTLAATIAYSETHIENIKTLLLYAQIQTAKLQYKAAKELLELDLRKDIVENSADRSIIDLEKYMMQ